MKKHRGRVRNSHEKYFGYKLAIEITVENYFGRLKGRFGWLRRAMDIDINTLPQV